MLRERLVNLAVNNLRSTPRRAAVSAMGVMIASCVLFMVVGHGFAIRALVTDKVIRELPINMLEVGPKTLDLGMFKLDAHKLFGGSQINEGKLQVLSKIAGVEAVYPKLEVKLPLGARGGGEIFGRSLYTDLFMVGVPRALLLPEVGETLNQKSSAIPVVISDQLLDIYNQSVASALGMPQITAQLITGFEFDMVVGKSLMLGSRGAKSKGVERARIVGASRYALRLGVTVPLDVARGLIGRYGESTENESYSSVLIRAKRPEDIPAIADAVEELGLSLDKGARQIADIMNMILVFFTLLGSSMLVMAALNIGHSFFAQVTERRAELGILRALGARRRDVMLLVLSQAAVIGMVGGLVGCILGLGVAGTLDAWILGSLPEFAFKPDTLFLFPPAMFIFVWLSSILAAVLGAAWPAWSVANASVTQVLSD
jgi:putative ABC transport system permease protein